MSPSSALQRARRLLLGTLLVYATLVATHRGEFWPFSIYPRFAQADDAWSRAVVRDVSADEPEQRWAAYSLDALPGRAFPLTPNGVDNKDLSNFVSKTKDWTPRRTEGLRSLFRDHVDTRALLVMRVRGHRDGDTFTMDFIPYVYLAPDTTAINPALRLPPTANARF